MFKSGLSLVMNNACNIQRIPNVPLLILVKQQKIFIALGKDMKHVTTNQNWLGISPKILATSLSAK